MGKKHVVSCRGIPGPIQARTLSVGLNWYLFPAALRTTESFAKLKSWGKKWGMACGMARSLKIHWIVIQGIHINTSDKGEELTYYPWMKSKQNQLPTVTCQINKRCWKTSTLNSQICSLHYPHSHNWWRYKSKLQLSLTKTCITSLQHISVHLPSNKSQSYIPLTGICSGCHHKLFHKAETQPNCAVGSELPT